VPTCSRRDSTNHPRSQGGGSDLSVPQGQGGNAIHQGGGSMTKVKFINEFYFFEYQTCQGVPQRFHYYLNAALYPFSPLMPGSSTHWPLTAEKTVFSDAFLPERVFSKRFLR
jgi:hypothetical protein